MSTLRVTASVLNLRETPTTDARVLLKLPSGFRVVRVGGTPDGGWHQVQAQSTAGPITGWISAQYAVPDAPAPAAATTPDLSAPAAGEEFPWLKVAKAEMARGVVEIAGDQDNPRIVEYHSATTLHATDDETPWCSAFANWVMKQAGIKGTGLANARSWLDWGRKLDAPVPGCVVVLKRGTSPTSGHVGFYLEPKGDRIAVLGGNQGNSVKVSNYLVADVLGYRLPA